MKLLFTLRAVLLIVLLGAAGAPVAAQPGLNNVPSAVQTAFAKQFKGAAPTPVWDRRHGNRWEAAFRQTNGKAVVTTFAADGAWLQTAEVVAARDLPTEARTYLLSQYPQHPPRRAARVTHADGALTWQANAGHQQLIFDQTGHLLRAGREARTVAAGKKKHRTAPILDAAPAAPAAPAIAGPAVVGQ